ncbi:MAG: methylase, partial [Bacteroidales bacterium]|nr:methylase [Bacteroidales bacterium]
MATKGENSQRKQLISQFVTRWKGKGYEKGESQTFWIELLHDVLGVERPTEFISFESQVMLSHTSFIDAYIPSTKVLIEQKSIDKDLRASIRQSDGTMLTPFQQAKRYASELPVSKHPRWVVVCNFQSFLIYD